MSVHQSGPGAVKGDELKTRPERRFEARRVLFIVLPVIFILFVCGVFFRSCQDPMGGGLAAKGRATATPAFFDVNGRPTAYIVTATPDKSVRRAGGVVGLDCWVNADIAGSELFLPSGSKVVVTGFTFAGGGRVEISGFGWVSQGLVRCDGDVVELEKPYLVPNTVVPTPTITVTAVKQTVVPQKIYVQGPTYTPYPTYTPFPSVSSSGFGVYRESGDCWRFDISDIREIRVNRGDPVAGGSLVCGVKSFTVVVR